MLWRLSWAPVVAHRLRMGDRWLESSGEKRLMLAVFDRKNLSRLFVALALMLAVVGPACFLMSPDVAAAASGMSGGGCESSSEGPQASFDGCPHSDTPDPVGVTSEVSKLLPATLAVVVEPAIPSAVQFIDRSVSDGSSVSDASRIRPLRL